MAERPSVIPIVLLGAAGRMGKAVEEAAASAPDVRVRLRIDRAAPTGTPVTTSEPRGGSPGYQSPPGALLDPRVLREALEPGDVVVDFSGPEGTREAAEACAEKGVALVSGTTGLDAAAEAAIATAASKVAVLRAANFSIGILALRRVLVLALGCVPHDWDIEIVERHHRQKVDSPSGTALVLAREAAGARSQAAPDLRHGRQGRVGTRAQNEIGVHAVRGGTWIGDHEVLLAGAGEWLELRHVAQDRGAFARGALAAARFVATAEPGLYTLDHLLRPPS